MTFFLGVIGIAICTFGIVADAAFLIMTAIQHTDDNLL